MGTGMDGGAKVGFFSFLFAPAAPTSDAQHLPLKRHFLIADTIPTDYVVIDIETSGLDACTCEILEICAIRYREGIEAGRFHSFVRPIGRIAHEATKVNGIRWRNVYNAPLLATVKSEFLAFIGDDTLVGHNIGFDMKFIQTRFEMSLKNKCFDTLDWSKVAFPDASNYRLDTLRHEFDLGGSAHSASGDCIATHNLLQIIATSSYVKERMKNENEAQRKFEEAYAQRRKEVSERRENLQRLDAPKAECLACSKLTQGTNDDYMSEVIAILARNNLPVSAISKWGSAYSTLQYANRFIFGVKTTGQLKYIVLPIPIDQVNCQYPCTVSSIAEGDFNTRIYIQTVSDLNTISDYIIKAYQLAVESSGPNSDPAE